MENPGQFSVEINNLRAFGISRNRVPARDLVVPVVRRSSYLRFEKLLKPSLRLLR